MRAFTLNVSAGALVGLIAVVGHVPTVTAEDDLSDWNPLPSGRSFVIVPILFPEEEDGLQATIWEDMPLYLPGGGAGGGNQSPGGGAIETNPPGMTQDKFQLMCEAKPGNSFEVAADGRWVCCKVDWGCFICNEAMDCEVDCESPECEIEYGSDYQGPHFDNPAAEAACQKDGDGDGFPDGIYSEFDDGGWSCCDPDYGCLECHPGTGCEMMCFTPECHDTMNSGPESAGPGSESNNGSGKRYRRANHSRSRQ